MRFCRVLTVTVIVFGSLLFSPQHSFFHFHFIIKLLAAYSTVAIRSRLFFHPFFLSLVNQHGAFLCHRFSALALVYFRHPRKLRLMHDPKCQVQLREYSVAGIACLLGAYSP